MDSREALRGFPRGGVEGTRAFRGPRAGSRDARGGATARGRQQWDASVFFCGGAARVSELGDWVALDGRHRGWPFGMVDTR